MLNTELTGAKCLSVTIARMIERLPVAIGPPQTEYNLNSHGNDEIGRWHGCRLMPARPQTEPSPARQYRRSRAP